MNSLIHHTFAPHVDAAYAWETLKLLLKPRKWKRGKETEEFRLALAKYFHAEAHLFASGREALLALLQSLCIGKGDEVIIQSYTCVVVPNAIVATGATPIYADIDPEILNLTPETVEEMISNRTKAVICQHTFGIPADTERLRTLCNQYELTLIEDCAQVIPDCPLPPEERVQPSPTLWPASRVKGSDTIGKYGDYLILSFGRDKAISGIAGGALIKNNPDARCQMPNTSKAPNKKTLAKISPPYNLLATTDIARLLLYPLLYFIARPLYVFGIGKLLLWLSAKLGLLIPIVTKKEKEGHMDRALHTIPNACAVLALTQFKKLQEINDHRRMLTKFYLQAFKDRGWRVLEGITEDLPLQKFPMFVEKSPLPAGEGVATEGDDGEGLPASSIRFLLKKKNIHLDDGWTDCVVCPASVNPKDASYPFGSDLAAEGMAKSILSLPTHPTMTLTQARTLMEVLDTLLQNSTDQP